VHARSLQRVPGGVSAGAPVRPCRRRIEAITTLDVRIVPRRPVRAHDFVDIKSAQRVAKVWARRFRRDHGANIAAPRPKERPCGSAAASRFGRTVGYIGMHDAPAVMRQDVHAGIYPSDERVLGRLENHAGTPILHVLQLRSRPPDAPRVTPAMEAGLADHVGPSMKSSPSSGNPENVLVRVERLCQHAEEFQETVEEELRTARALL
jgi:hypothetical protein